MAGTDFEQRAQPSINIPERITDLAVRADLIAAFKGQPATPIETPVVDRTVYPYTLIGTPHDIIGILERDSTGFYRGDFIQRAPDWKKVGMIVAQDGQVNTAKAIALRLDAHDVPDISEIDGGYPGAIDAVEVLLCLPSSVESRAAQAEYVRKLIGKAEKATSVRQTMKASSYLNGAGMLIAAIAREDRESATALLGEIS